MIIALVTLILLAFTPAGISADYSLNISDLIGKLNVAPRFAMNPLTGDVLVVWTQLDSKDASFGRVWCALLKRDKDGRYSVAARNRLNAGKKYGARPFPIFNKEMNHYFVVWDQADPSDPLGVSNIRGRAVKPDGSMEGKPITVMSAGLRIVSPHLYDMTLPGAPRPADKPIHQVMIAVNFFEINKNTYQRLGLHTDLLDLNYRSNNPALIWQGATTTFNGSVFQGGIIPDGIGSVFNGNVILPVIRQIMDGNSRILSEPLILVLNGAKALVDWDNVGQAVPKLQTGLATTTVLSPSGQTLVIAGLVQNGRAKNQVSKVPILNNIPLLGILFRSTVRENTESTLLILITPELVNPNDRPTPPASNLAGYQLFAGTDGWVYKRKLKNTGKLAGKEKKVFNHSKKLQSMYGRDLFFGQAEDGKREALVVWQKKVNKKKHVIEARFFTLKK